MAGHELTISARRALVAHAREDAAFKLKLQQDGIAAIAEDIGVTLPANMTVKVIEEPGDGHYVGVLPRDGALVDGLPEPANVRDAWENMLLSTLAMDAEARAELLDDPVEYAQQLWGTFPGTRLEILEETASQTYLVIDQMGAAEDELDDFSLDLVSAGDAVTGGGGNPACVESGGTSRSNKL